MWRSSRACCLVAVWVLMAALILGGCKGTSSLKGDMWAPSATFQMTLQPLTDQEKEKIRSALSPSGEDLVFDDEPLDPMRLNKNAGFYYMNSAFSDAQISEKVESREEALDMAESFLRSIDLLPAEEDYYVDFVSPESENGKVYSNVSFYYKFHNMPALPSYLSAIRIDVCKDGVWAIHYRNRYTIQTIDQPESASSYISENQAIASYRDRLKEKCCGPTVVADEDICFTRVYVYRDEKAVPMYMFGEDGNPFYNPIYVDAVSGEATDFPWDS